MARPITPDMLVYDVVTAGDPQISPDGSRIVYTRSQTDRATKKPNNQLWLCDRDGANQRRLTWSGDNNGGARWSPDGRNIAFLSDRGDKPGIYVLSLGGGEGRQVTGHAAPITELAWAPDGSRLAYVAQYDPDNPDEQPPDKDAAPKVRVTRRLDYKADGRGYLGETRMHVWVVDVASGERRRISDALLDHMLVGWSPDGARVGAVRMSPEGAGMQLALVDVATGETTLVGPEDGMVGTWAFSPSGDRVIFAGDPDVTFQPDFFIYELATGETRRLTDELDVVPGMSYPGVGGMQPPVWLDERQVLFAAIRAGASGLYVIDSERGSVVPVYRWQSANLAGLSVDDARHYAVGVQTGFENAGELVVYDLRSNTVRQISALNDATLSAANAARWERFEVRRGAFTVEAWLFMPPDLDESKKYPVVLDIHGGPTAAYGYAVFPWQQVLATHGFLVVAANPRGSTTYGRAFTSQVLGDLGGGDYFDLLAVLDKALERPYADAERVGMWGYSYGGYMTSWMLGHTDRFKACVCGAPAYDLEAMYGTSDSGYTYAAKLLGGVSLAEDPGKYVAHSPATYAHKATTPTLVVVGEADERCPAGQAEQLFVTLKKAGCEVEFARYPGQSHGFLLMGPPEHRADFYQRSLDWFKQHLGDPR